MSLTTIEPGKQLYTLLYQYVDKITKQPIGTPAYIYHMGKPILTTDHDAIVEHANSLLRTFISVIYTISSICTHQLISVEYKSAIGSAANLLPEWEE